MDIINQIKGGLIVSCQALKNEPLHGSEHMVAMARAAMESGAVAIRANGPEDIKAIKEEIELPLIGIYKKNIYNSNIYITPTLQEIKVIYKAGADIIAIDATCRLRPGGVKLNEFVKKIRDNYNIPLMGDVSNLEEGIKAQELGFDLVGTTLSGYTDYTKSSDRPDFKLLRQLVQKLSIPVIMEGRVRTPAEAKKALQLGAYAVVVGAAITRPQVITSRFVEAINNKMHHI